MKTLSKILAVFVLCFFIGCADDIVNEGGSGGTDASNDGTTQGGNATGTDFISEIVEVSSVTFDNTVAINLTSKTATVGETASTISAVGVTLATVGETTLTIADLNDGYGTIVITSTLESAVKYTITGTLSGSLVLISDTTDELYFNDATITATGGPAVYVKNGSVYVVAEGTNTFTDSAAHSNGYKKAAFYADGKMIFSGSGSIVVNASFKNGIQSDDFIYITEGNISVNNSAKDCVRALNGFVMDDGTLTLKGTGSETDEESKGIKVDGDESEYGAGKGYIIINGGTLSIDTMSKAITASWDWEEDGDTTWNSTNEPYPYVEINGGTINIKTRVTPYEYKTTVDGTSVTYSCSPEGIEGKQELIINDGNLYIDTTDDCINVSCDTSHGGKLTINGGNLYCYSTTNDSIDCNGTLTINGGVIVARGTNTPECAFDCDSNTFTITGGLLVGIGTSNYSKPTATTCTQSVFVVGSSYVTSGSAMAILDASNNVVFAYDVPSTFEIMILSSPAFTNGASYTLYKGGTASGTSFNGLYSGSVTYTGGTSSATFTESTTSTVNYVGTTTTGGGAMEGTPGTTSGGFRPW